MFLRGNHRDRWLLTYADFITLLFATFVLMYATAKAKEGSKILPAKTVPEALEQARPIKAAMQSNLLTDLQKELRLEQQSALLAVSVDQRGIVIALDDRTCFRPGQSRVEPSAVPLFNKVAGILARYNNRILLEGHTDSVPIHTGQFRSNWELSTARSIAVMELMSSVSPDLRSERFLIGGSADNTPVTSNQTEQGRAHNRRVEIIVLDPPASGSMPPEHPVSAITSP
jgi:chemotaxis protein MotB